MKAASNKKLWFVIDDDLDDQEIFTIAVEKVDPDIQCTFANDGVHALERLRTDSALEPECIFLDVNMPRMNGIECLEVLRTFDRLQHVPIYMCSTSSDPKIIEKIKALGARDFIVKPSTISEFAALLADVNKTLQSTA
ncbi:MAG TPA: response regulator [Cyclobacteriaceae bacterium]|nr:response regulator [Cyclobacteriaceae bacterium]HMV11109.1 response regulator [Cyclobacteriaceae bacterium]HMV88942.1 response regulator [Cyclobacteriaceae bacterium]HMX01097.1 response regulator [Cyclobacteriaceae bacterium]HMX51913.1 response regulator [Cyclobacteriaceae bacterium]